MINWDTVKFMGVIYIIMTTMITVACYSISLIGNIPFEGFWSVGLFMSSIYWGIVFLISAFKN